MNEFDFHVMKNRLKDLKKTIQYNGNKYTSVTDLCVTEGINRDVFVWLYLSTNWTIKKVIEMAISIENLE